MVDIFGGLNLLKKCNVDIELEVKLGGRIVLAVNLSGLAQFTSIDSPDPSEELMLLSDTHIFPLWC